MTKDKLSLDSSPTRRHKDENGFLHVSLSHISKETVNPYYGREIPGWQDQGLEPDKVYYGYRKGSELEKGADTFNGLPLLMGHYPESADDPQKEHRIGSLGTDAAFNSPYLDNSLIITDSAAIEALENGDAVELSSAYRYDPVFESGKFDGEHYDFIMTNIRGNHVALVEEGRAGPDVAVADEQINLNPNNTRNNFMGKFTKLAKKLLTKSGMAADEAEVVEAAEKLVEAIGEEVVEKTLDENNPSSTSSDNDPDKKPDTPAEDDDEDCVELMKAAGLDPEDPAAKAAFMAGMKAAKPAADEAQEGESEDADKAQDNDPPKAEDNDNEEEDKSKTAADRKSVRHNGVKHSKEKPLTAQDAALIKAEARQEASAHIKGLHDAARVVRDLCGEVDALTFDSKADIYRHALEQTGHKVKTKDVAALLDMVNMAKDTKAATGARNTPAFATSKMDGAFSGLNRIKIQ